MAINIHDDPQDWPFVDFPRGSTAALKLPNKLCYSLVEDEIHESAGGGKSYLQTIVDLAIQQDGLGVVKVIWDVLDRVGETETAQDWLRENYP